MQGDIAIELIKIAIRAGQAIRFDLAQFAGCVGDASKTRRSAQTPVRRQRQRLDQAE